MTACTVVHALECCRNNAERARMLAIIAAAMGDGPGTEVLRELLRDCPDGWEGKPLADAVSLALRRFFSGAASQEQQINLSQCILGAVDEANERIGRLVTASDAEKAAVGAIRAAREAHQDPRERIALLVRCVRAAVEHRERVYAESITTTRSLLSKIEWWLQGGPLPAVCEQAARTGDTGMTSLTAVEACAETIVYEVADLCGRKPEKGQPEPEIDFAVCITSEITDQKQQDEVFKRMLDAVQALQSPEETK